MFNELYPQQVSTSFLNNPSDQLKAIEWASKEPLGIRFLQNGVLVSSADPEMTLVRMNQVKGERKGPFGLIIPDLSFITKTIDRARIPKEFHNIKQLEKLQGLCFIRYPFREDLISLAHNQLFSRNSKGEPIIQVLYFGQNQPDTHRFINALHKANNNDPISVSSMNLHGEKTPITEVGALKYLNESNLPKTPKAPVYIVDKLPPFYSIASFPIVTLDENGAHITRLGNTRQDDLKAVYPQLQIQLDQKSAPKNIETNSNRVRIIKYICQYMPQCANIILRNRYVSPTTK